MYSGNATGVKEIIIRVMFVFFLFLYTAAK